MKRHLSLLICTLVLSALFTPCVSAQEWSEAYYRAVDTSGELSDAQIDSLDAACIEIVSRHHIDVSLLAVMPSDHEGASLEQVAEEYYLGSGFGYGEFHDGVMFVFDTGTEDVAVVLFGRAKDVIPESYVDFIKEKAPTFREQYGTWGVLYAGAALTGNYLDKHMPQDDGGGLAVEKPPVDDEGGSTDKMAEEEKEESDESDEEIEIPTQSSAERIGDGESMPTWYPDDTENFVFYQDADAPRVVDEADIFTEEEEIVMLTRIEGLRQDYKTDVVIYTTNTSYGLGETTLAQDFYDFNGYGAGEEWEGFCLCVVMDPNDRAMCTAATGSYARGLFTNYNADLLDDALYEYFRDKTDDDGNTVPGEYGAGVIDWLENLRTLYAKGHAFAPSWYPDMDEDFVQPSSTDLPRVSDETGSLTEEQLSELSQRASELSEKLGVDVVINIAADDYWLEPERYAELYYYYNGFGFGDDHSGILLSVIKDTGTAKIYACGRGEECIYQKGRKRLINQVESRSLGGETYKAAEHWLKGLEHAEKTGRVNYSAARWIFISIIDAALGAFTGIKAREKAEKNMTVVRMQTDATAYVVPGSIKILGRNDTCVRTVTSRTYSPVSTSSSSGSSRSYSSSGSSSHSSYSSSSSGSSGRSHTTSSRKF